MQITNIRQLLPFIEGKPEFLVLDKGPYKVIDYVYQDKDTFDKPELMECRGIKFDKEGLILARPFPKFFNYGERDTNLPVHRPHVITEKMDGSMVHPVMIDRKLYLHTRKGHTDVAKKAERFAFSSSCNYSAFCKHAIAIGYTPILEYTGPNNRIVLRYEEENLTLLAMRHMVTGSMFTALALDEWFDAFGVPIVKRHTFDLKGDLKGFIEHTRALKDAEGYVIYFDDGYMVKIKAEDYVLKHRALDDLSSKKKVVALCAQGFMDDVLPILSEVDAAELIEFNHALQDEINLIVEVAHGLAKRVTSGMMDRKSFALEWVPTIKPDWLASVCFAIIDGKDARRIVIKHITRHYDEVVIKWRGE